jgi:hypothetical protein
MGNKQWVLTQADALDQVLKWKARKIENYVEPAWGTEWPNDPPNWTNEPTPNDGDLWAVLNNGVFLNGSVGIVSIRKSAVAGGLMAD